MPTISKLYLTKRWESFYNAWFKLQLTHYGGKYSIERMLALEEYTQNTSLFRVVVVAFTPPVILVVFLLCQEMVPLQDPAKGWESNSGFWVRCGILVAMECFVLIKQLEVRLNIPRLSLRQMLIHHGCVSIGMVAFSMAVAKIWVFPVPFGVFLLLIPFAAVHVGFLRIVVGASAFHIIISKREQLRQLRKVGRLAGLLLVAYPCFQVLFDKVKHTTYELPVLLVLPLFRVIMKYAFRLAASNIEDSVPEQVIFTADFFDALYLATFMPTLSTTSLALIVILDVLQMAIELYEFHQKSRGVLARIAAIPNIDIDRGLLTGLRSLCSSSDTQFHAAIRVRSCISHQLSGEARTLLDKIDTSTSTHLHGWVNRSPEPVSQAIVHYRFDAVQPLPPPTKMMPNTKLVKGATRNEFQRSQSIVDNSRIVRDTLEVLFMSECLVLTEYLEIVVPVLYSTFLLCMVHVPNAKYHSDMEGVTLENVGNMVSRMYIYALLEFISFIALGTIMRFNSGIHALYQVAFVLETQMSVILSRLMVWMLMTLTYRVTHFGTDFSFEFKWIGQIKK